jgi:Enoyl-(Acyl carrier protein) reductase
MQQKSGKIINISSMNGQTGSFGQANYSAAKAGIVGFTKTAALELARFNVTVNAICPGFIATEMFEAIPEKPKEAILARIPLGRAGTPQEVARAVRYLIVDGDYYTGAEESTPFSVQSGSKPGISFHFTKVEEEFQPVLLSTGASREPRINLWPCTLHRTASRHHTNMATIHLQ